MSGWFVADRTNQDVDPRVLLLLCEGQDYIRRNVVYQQPNWMLIDDNKTVNHSGTRAFDLRTSEPIELSGTKIDS